MIENETARHALTLTLPSDREIEMTRTFDAPRELVFEAFSKPEHIRRWWGLRESELVVCDMDFRPGGSYRYVSREADGNEYGFRGEYREIVRPERLVYTFEFEGMPGHICVETITLEENDGRTTLTNRSIFDTTEDRDGMISSGMEEGARQTWDRLEEYLQELGK